MPTLTGIPDAGLAKAVATTAFDNLKVVSITKAADGTWTIVTEANKPASTATKFSLALPPKPPVANMDQPTAPADAAHAFVHARQTAPKTILYVDAGGREEIREGGSRAWRNCNPGNIRKGDFSVNCGAIGDDGSFAIFPSEAIGMAAIVSLLKSKAYIDLTLHDAIFRYAPPSENNSQAYANYIAQHTGIALTSLLSALNADQFRTVAATIQVIEGWTAGTIRPNAPLAPLLTATLGTGSSAASAAEDWMSVARAEAALAPNERSQWSDPGENPRILNYFRTCAPWFDPADGDEVDWCAAFVNYCLVTSGHMGTDHPGARSFFWNKKKQFVSLPGPAVGAIAVRRYAPFSDPAWASGDGHVGFVVSWTGTSVTLLGGNQSDTVRESTFPLIARDAAGNVTAQFIAFMMPVIA